MKRIRRVNIFYMQVTLVTAARLVEAGRKGNESCLIYVQLTCDGGKSGAGVKKH